jgi:metallophosphoesterase superfamily enzyme
VVERRLLAPGIVADARRAVWLEPQRTLLLADLHLGFVWVERQHGALLPLVDDDAPERISDLLSDYQPERCVFLGDTLHATAHLNVLEEEFGRLIEHMDGFCEFSFVLGNHDSRLPDMLIRLGQPVPCVRIGRAGPHTLIHGDTLQATDLMGHRDPQGWVFYGHEHPAVSLGDGVTTRVKAPSFLIGPQCLVLPAFSRWSAGMAFGRQALLSRLHPPESFRQALVILGDRLLPVDLTSGEARPFSSAPPEPSDHFPYPSPPRHPPDMGSK